MNYLLYKRGSLRTFYTVPIFLSPMRVAPLLDNPCCTKDSDNTQRAIFLCFCTYQHGSFSHPKDETREKGKQLSIVHYSLIIVYCSLIIAPLPLRSSDPQLPFALPNPYSLSLLVVARRCCFRFRSCCNSDSTSASRCRNFTCTRA